MVFSLRVLERPRSYHLLICSASIPHSSLQSLLCRLRSRCEYRQTVGKKAGSEANSLAFLCHLSCPLLNNMFSPPPPPSSPFTCHLFHPLGSLHLLSIIFPALCSTLPLHTPVLFFFLLHNM